ncbi:hypothetical protein BJ138DRAFT_265032 [Hygrophoropsis aurantiaca]|uniref:Uncharacterized protein n=1 Tax=Hygrophoropsis aurantiaca TaxID=72124 RepID=A0ACB8APM1_9AGAM|nr:hypothetical protein BJ138DRAFT_265032 [Hygrophoropsis aurantiaca]
MIVMDGCSSTGRLLVSPDSCPVPSLISQDQGILVRCMFRQGKCESWRNWMTKIYIRRVCATATTITTEDPSSYDRRAGSDFLISISSPCAFPECVTGYTSNEDCPSIDSGGPYLHSPRGPLLSTVNWMADMPRVGGDQGGLDFCCTLHSITIQGTESAMLCSFNSEVCGSFNRVLYLCFRAVYYLLQACSSRASHNRFVA